MISSEFPAPGPRLVVFDVDGTLADSQHNILAAMDEAFAALGLPPPDPLAVRGVIGLSLAPAIEALVTPTTAGEGPDPGLVHRLGEAYRAAFFARRTRPDFHEPLFPGARVVMESLAAEGVLLGLATGKSARGVLAFLERHDLGGSIAAWRCADHGPGKPDPWMLRAVMDDLGCAPAATVMIGDTTFDMAMARSAGTGAIGVGWGSHPPDQLLIAGAQALARDMGEIPGLVTRIWQQETSA